MSQSPEARMVWREARAVFDEHPESPFADTDAADLAAASVIEAALQKARDEERVAVVAHMEWWSSQGGDDEPGWLEALAGQIQSGEHRREG